MKPEYTNFSDFQPSTDFSNSEFSNPEFSNPGSNNKFYGTLEHDMRKSMEQPVEEPARSDSVSQSSSSQRSTTPVTKFAFSCIACAKGVSSDRSLRRHYTTCIKYKEMLAEELATLPPGAESKLAPKKRNPGGGGGKRTVQKKKAEPENKPEEKNSAIVAALEKRPTVTTYQAPPPPAYHNPYQSVGALPSLSSSWFGGSASTSTSMRTSPTATTEVDQPSIPKNTSQLKLLIDEDDGDSRSSSGTERKASSSHMYVCEKCSKPLCSMSNLKRHRQTCKIVPPASIAKKVQAPLIVTTIPQQAPPTPQGPPPPSSSQEASAPPTPAIVTTIQAPPPLVQAPPPPPPETTAVVTYCQSYTKSPEKLPMVSPNKKEDFGPMGKEPTVGESLRAQLNQSRSHNKAHHHHQSSNFGSGDPQQMVSFQQRYIATTRAPPLTSMGPRFPNPILNQDQNPPRQGAPPRQAPPTPAQIQHTPMPSRHHSPQIRKGVIEHKNTDLVLITSEPLAEKAGAKKPVENSTQPLPPLQLRPLGHSEAQRSASTTTVAYQVQFGGRPLPNPQNPQNQMMMMPQGLQNPPRQQMNVVNQNSQYQQMPQNQKPNQNPNQMTFQPKLNTGQQKLLQIQQRRVFSQAPPPRAQTTGGKNPNQKEMCMEDVKEEDKKTPGSPLDSIITSVPLSVEVHHHHHGHHTKTPLTDSQGLSSVDSSAADDNSPPGSSRSQSSRLIPYICPECDKIYSCRKNVKRHRMAVHKMSLEEVLAKPEQPAPPDAVLTCHINTNGGRRHTVAGLESGNVAPKSRKRKASAAASSFAGKKGKEIKKIEETEDESEVETETVADIEEEEEMEENEDVKDSEEIQKMSPETQSQELPKLRPSAFPSVFTILPKTPSNLNSNGSMQHQSFQNFGPLRTGGQEQMPRKESMQNLQNFGAPIQQFQNPRPLNLEQVQIPQNQVPMKQIFGPPPPPPITAIIKNSNIQSSRIQNQDSTITYTPIPNLPNRTPNLQSPPQNPNPMAQNPNSRIQSPQMHQNSNPMVQNQSPPLQNSNSPSHNTSTIENPPPMNLMSPTPNQISNQMPFPRPSQMNDPNPMIPRVQNLLPSIQNLRTPNPEPMQSPTTSVDQNPGEVPPFQAPPPYYQAPPPNPHHMPWMQPGPPVVPHPSWGLPPNQDFHMAPPLAAPPLQAPPTFDSNGWGGPTTHYPPPPTADPSWGNVQMMPEVPVTSSTEVPAPPEEPVEPPRRTSAEEDSRAMAKIAAELKRFAEVDSSKSRPAEIQKQPQEDSEFDAHLFETIREEYRQSAEDFQKEEDLKALELFQYPIDPVDSSNFVEASSLPSSSLPSSLASPEIHGLPVPEQKQPRSSGSRKSRPRSQNLACTGCMKVLGSDYALRRHRMSCVEVQKQRNPEYPKPPKRRQKKNLDEPEELQSEEETPMEVVKEKRRRVSKYSEMSKEEREQMCLDAERRAFEAGRDIEMMEAMPAPSVVMDTVDELQMERDAMNLKKSPPPPTTNAIFTSTPPAPNEYPQNSAHFSIFSSSSTTSSSRESSTSISPPAKTLEISSNLVTSSESMSSESTITAPSAGAEKSYKQAKHMCQECIKSLCSAYGLKRHNLTCPSASDEKFYEPTSPEDRVDVLFRKDDAWGVMSFELLQKVSKFFVAKLRDGEPNRRLDLDERWLDFRQFLEVHERISRVTAENMDSLTEQSQLYECPQVGQMVETYKKVDQESIPIQNHHSPQNATNN